jgi:hypothetical protein
MADDSYPDIPIGYGIPLVNLATDLLPAPTVDAIREGMVALDEDGLVPDEQMPERLSEPELSATIDDAVPAVGDPRYARSTRPNSIASLGDSISLNGAIQMLVGVLAAPATAGATTISLTPTTAGSGTQLSQVQSSLQNGYLVQIGTEYVVLGTNTFSGSAPYTVNLSAALASSHAAGEIFVSVPMIQANNSPCTAWWAAQASDGALRFTAAFGGGGYKASEVRAIYLPLVIQARPGYCWVMAGRNSEPGGQASTVAEVVAIWDELIEAGITPIGSALPPLTTPTDVDSWINSRLQSEASARAIPFLDPRESFLDPATGAWNATYLNDGTHPNPAGRRKLGLDLWSVMSARVTGAAKQFPRANTQLDNDVHVLPVPRTNAKMLTSGGTVVGTSTSVLPAGWQCSVVDADGVFTRPDAPSGGGKSMKYVRTAAGTVTNTVFNITAGTLIQDHRYRVSMRIKTSGLSAAYAASSSSRIDISVSHSTASGTPTFGTFSPINFDIDGGLVWDFIVTAQQPKSLVIYAALRGGAATTSYTFEMWDVDVVDLTELGTESEFPHLFA